MYLDQGLLVVASKRSSGALRLRTARFTIPGRLGAPLARPHRVTVKSLVQDGLVLLKNGPGEVSTAQHEDRPLFVGDAALGETCQDVFIARFFLKGEPNLNDR